MDEDDKLLQYLKTLNDQKIICNLYLSYMQAIDFIIEIGFDEEYQEFAEAEERRRSQKKMSRRYQKYIADINKTTTGEN
mgnify:FL=1|tara:strand:+ start:61 stop:297 length:237 start_codon:yes stop_codon:yes gene_type:complete